MFTPPSPGWSTDPGRVVALGLLGFVAGALVCLVGVAVIMYAPRTAL